MFQVTVHRPEKRDDQGNILETDGFYTAKVHPRKLDTYHEYLARIGHEIVSEAGDAEDLAELDEISKLKELYAMLPGLKKIHARAEELVAVADKEKEKP